MEKIFKKSLALVLSAALCLTALVGCLTVSAAAETTPAYAISTDAKGKVGDTVEVIAEYTNISTVCGHYVTVTFPANFTVKEVYQAKESADGETYKLLTAYKEGSEENWQYKMDVVEGKTAIKSCDIINFFASEGSEHNVTTGSLKFKFVVTIGEVVVGEYPVTIAVEAASQDEMWITPVITNGKITVEANTPAHTYADAWSYDETEHWHACTVVGHTDVADKAAHEWNDGVVTKKATNDVAGEKTYTCTVCAKTRVEEIPVIVPETINLTFQHTLSLQSNIKIAVVPTLTNEFKNAKTVYAISQQTKRNSDTKEFYLHTSEPYYAASNGYFYYADIYAFEMPQEVTTVIYACDEDGNVIYKSNEDKYSIVQYAANQFMNPRSSDKLKTVLADLLNYGAAAQVYANYDNLVNTIGDVETRYGTANISSLVSQYQTVGDPEMTSVAENIGDLSLNLRNSLSMKSTLEVAWAVPKTELKDSMRIVITYKGNEYSYTAAEFESFNSSYNALYFGEVIAVDFNQPITAVLYDGDVAVSNTRVYSIESYCKSKENDSDPKLVSVCKAIMKYGNAARVYFNK